MNAVVRSVNFLGNTDSTLAVERGGDRRRPMPGVRAPALLIDRAPRYAPWLGEIAARIEELVSLPENWDSYGASVPSRVAAEALLEILAQITTAATPRPAIVPSPDGHFQAEWHENGVDLEVEVISRSHIDVFFGSNHQQWNQVLKSDFKALVDAIDQLSV